MEFTVKFDINEKIYVRNPESSEVGKLMVKEAIDLIYEVGFDQFTFKKLATEIGSTEATIYRYFENKHRLLLYILNWYWSYMEFLLTIKLDLIKDKKERLKIIINLLTHELESSSNKLDYNKQYLNHIVIAESSKVYLVKDVQEINKDEVFKPYKDLCKKIADAIIDYKPSYKYARSLSTTLIETSHHQQYFCLNLPRLTDIDTTKKTNFTYCFLEDLLFKAIA
jgi:AcrR family transcriptional regulator